MDKFEEFQTTLAKSNEVFTTFRQEMEKVRRDDGAASQPLLISLSLSSYIFFCVDCLNEPIDDKEDQVVGKGNHAVEREMGK